jgi:hypothetical protein
MRQMITPFQLITQFSSQVFANLQHCSKTNISWLKRFYLYEVK